MPDLKTIRIFISSPSDVRPERLIAERVVQRLDREFAYHFHVEAVLWEREPLVATHHFQDFENIPPPSTTDIVVVVLWSRLGVPLPAEKFSGAVSGKVPVTGTEWEFEDALRAYQDHGKPDLLLYQKTAPVTATLDNDDVLEQRRQQKRLVEDFLTRWFRNNTGSEFTAASHAFAEVAEFEERLDTHLRGLLRKRLEGAGTAEGSPVGIRWHQNPFRGLESFEPEHAPIYFGRTRARNELRELLARKADKGCAFVLVMGASGSGKSSLVKAGLLPDLMLPGMVGRVALVRYALFRPSDAGGDPVMALADAMLTNTALPELTELAYTPSDLAEQLLGMPKQVAFAVKQGLGVAARAARLTVTAEARLVVVVDQLEELFTLDTVTPEARRAFVLALTALARSGLVWVVATMRSDFFDRLEGEPELLTLSAGEVRYLLAPPDAHEIGQIIREPAREAGVRFEVDAARGLALDEVLLKAAMRGSGSLPLLEYALDQLWQRRDAGGVIGFEAYEALGGLEGAIGRRAEAVLAEQVDAVREALPTVLRSLVTVGQGAKAQATARWAPLSSFPKGATTRALVDAFLAPDARLLIVDEDEAGTRVRVAHEALLTHWARASERIAEDRVDLQLRARLEAGAALWLENSKDESRLLPAGLPLAEALDLLARQPDLLSEDTARFVNASQAAELERKREELQRERAEKKKLKERLDLAQVNQTRFVTRVAEAEPDPEKQAALLLEVLPLRSGDPDDRPLVGKAHHQLALLQDRRRLRAVLHRSRVYAGAKSAAFSPDGTRLVTVSNNLARVWDTEGGMELVNLRGPERDKLDAALFSPDGTRILTIAYGGKLWDAATGADLAELYAHNGRLTSAKFNRDGTRLVTASEDQTARVWDVASGTELAVLRGHDGEVLSAVFSPDGGTVLTASGDMTARLWDAATGQERAVLRGHEHSVESANFSWDGTRIVTVGGETARLWNASDGAEVAVLGGIETPRTYDSGTIKETVHSADFSPDGNRVVTGWSDGTVRLWDIESGTELAVLRGDNNRVVSALFSPDGTRILSRTYDRTARLWDVASGSEITLFGGDDELMTSAQFSPDGTRVVTSSLSTRIWDAKGITNQFMLKTFERSEWDEQFDDTDFLRPVTWFTDDIARVWDGYSGPEVAVRRVMLSRRRACEDTYTIFSPDGRRVVTTDRYYNPRLWDASSGLLLARLWGDLRGNNAWFSPDGCQIVTSDGPRARLWDAAGGAELAVLDGHEDQVILAAFSPDTRRVITASKDGTARVWDTSSGAALAVWDLGGQIGFIIFNANGTRVITAPLRNSDTETRLWDVAGLTEIPLSSGELNKQAYPTFSPCGKFLATISEDTLVRIWDATSGTEAMALQGHGDFVNFATFSADCSRIATASSDRTARVWDAKSGAELAVLAGHESGVESVTFSLDGTMVLTTSDDRTIRVWDTASGAENATLRRSGRKFYHAEFDRDGTRVLAVSDSAHWHDEAQIWCLADIDTIDRARVTNTYNLDALTRIHLGLDADVRPPPTRLPTLNGECTECDRLASDPFDQQRVALGVDFGMIFPKKAIAACEAALATHPGEARFHNQLGRGLYRAKRLDEARASYTIAADAGHVAAFYNLGLLEERCGAWPEAMAWHRKAWEQGIFPSRDELLRLLLAATLSDLPDVRMGAAMWWREAAEKDDGWNHHYLAILLERGIVIDRDWSKATYHWAKATQFHEKRGSDRDAQFARDRRSALAYALPVAESARVWRLARDGNTYQAAPKDVGEEGAGVGAVERARHSRP